MWSIILEPRNGRGLPVEGNTVTPYEAGTEHHVVEFERELSLGRPYFLGSHPCTRGEFGVKKMATTVMVEPRCSACHNFLKDNTESVKSVWLAPHILRHRDDATIIIWRCSMGTECRAACLYARGDKTGGNFVED